jgi:hypothetical protein
MGDCGESRDAEHTEFQLNELCKQANRIWALGYFRGSASALKTKAYRCLAFSRLLFSRGLTLILLDAAKQRETESDATLTGARVSSESSWKAL